MRWVFRSPAFFVLLAIGVFNSIGALTGVTSVRDIDYLPVTRAVINALNGSYSLFAIVIAIYYSGELVWRDQDNRIDEIIGATPAPDWTFVLPKAVALTIVLLVSYLVAMLAGVLDQLVHGYTHLELGSLSALVRVAERYRRVSARRARDLCAGAGQTKIRWLGRDADLPGELDRFDLGRIREPSLRLRRHLACATVGHEWYGPVLDRPCVVSGLLERGRANSVDPLAWHVEARP